MLVLGWPNPLNFIRADSLAEQHLSVTEVKACAWARVPAEVGKLVVPTVVQMETLGVWLTADCDSQTMCRFRLGNTNERLGMGKSLLRPNAC